MQCVERAESESGEPSSTIGGRLACREGDSSGIGLKFDDVDVDLDDVDVDLDELEDVLDDVEDDFDVVEDDLDNVNDDFDDVDAKFGGTTIGVVLPELVVSITDH